MFNQRLIISGYGVQARRDIITSGIRKFKKKLSHPEPGQIYLFRNMNNVQERRISKMSEKTLWFNKIFYRKPTTRAKNSPNNQNPKAKANPGGPRWIDGVLMVPRTNEGALCKLLRDTEAGVRKTCTTALKILEEPGTQLKKLLSSDPWRSTCPRSNCQPCRNPDNKSTCNQRGVVYLSTCKLCKAEGKTTSYIGETSRSLFERTLDHLRDARKQDDESHIHYHLKDAHPDANSQELFEFKVVSSHKTSFSRQLGEAIAIMTYKGGSLLNRKEMFNRCKSPQFSSKIPPLNPQDQRKIRKV